MIGRAALGNPWLFREAAAELSGMPVPLRPTVAERIPVILEHLDGLIERHGEATGILEMRKHMAQYLKGTHGAAALKGQVMAALTRDEILAILDDWYRLCLKY